MNIIIIKKTTSVLIQCLNVNATILTHQAKMCLQIQQWQGCYGVANCLLMSFVDTATEKIYVCHCNLGQKTMAGEVIGPGVELLLIC